MIVQSSLETRQQLWHKQHSFSSLCLTPSRFFQQACISPSANLPYFSFFPWPEFIPFLITLCLSLSLCQIFYSHLPFLLISSPAVIWWFQPVASTLLCHSSCSLLSAHFLSHRFPVSTSIAALLPPTSSFSPCLILSCPCLHLTILAFMHKVCVSV